MYRPRPIDTSAVALPREVQSITERLAEHAHDVWAAQRMSQGWTRGVRRDDATKTHPSLVPYADLPDDEKDLDRAQVVGTLKACSPSGTGSSHPMALRTDEPAASPPLRYPVGAERRADYDLDDGPERALFAGSPTLTAALDDLGATLIPIYRELDRGAIRQQHRHRRLAALVAVCGTAAVVLATLQLTLKAGAWVDGWFSTVVGHSEFAVLLLAAVAVLVGLSLKLQKSWLVDRHKAERCRLAKFRLLADDRLWCGQRDDWRVGVREAAAEIAALDADTVERRALHDQIIEPPGSLATCTMPRSDLDAFTAYYASKRLSCQHQYFRSRAAGLARRDWPLRGLGPALFFMSVGASLLHSIHHALSHDPHEASAPHLDLGLLLLSAAAILPAVAAGIKTYRGAHEFGCSAAPFEAKAAAMIDFGRRLEAARGDAPAVLRVVWQCEDFLEAENREWLRLMLEAEFYG